MFNYALDYRNKGGRGYSNPACLKASFNSVSFLAFSLTANSSLSVRTSSSLSRIFIACCVRKVMVVLMHPTVSSSIVSYNQPFNVPLSSSSVLRNSYHSCGNSLSL